MWTSWTCSELVRNASIGTKVWMHSQTWSVNTITSFKFTECICVCLLFFDLLFSILHAKQSDTCFTTFLGDRDRINSNTCLKWNAYTCVCWTSSERIFMFACLWAALYMLTYLIHRSELSIYSKCLIVITEFLSNSLGYGPQKIREPLLWYVVEDVQCMVAQVLWWGWKCWHNMHQYWAWNQHQHLVVLVCISWSRRFT